MSKGTAMRKTFISINDSKSIERDKNVTFPLLLVI